MSKFEDRVLHMFMYENKHRHPFQGDKWKKTHNMKTTCSHIHPHTNKNKHTKTNKKNYIYIKKKKKHLCMCEGGSVTKLMQGVP